MSAVLIPPEAPLVPTLERPQSEQRLVLEDVTWQQYEAIGEILRDRPALRITYDRGTLEFMTTSPLHEILKMRLGRLLETLCEEFNLPLEPRGNMTFKREDLEKGLEPDQCYWITHEHQVRGKKTYDPKSDPPPDVVIEIEVSRGSKRRMGIYAAMGVPEVWRFDGESLVSCVLQSSGIYQAFDRSPTFPPVPLMELIRFMMPNSAEDYLSQVREFRKWIRGLTGK